MDNNRPRGREKNVTGPAKTVRKRGDGLGTGPVGSGQAGGGPAGSGPSRSSGGNRASGQRGGAGRLVALLLVLLLGGGGGITALLGGQGGTQPPSSGQSGSTGQSSGAGQSGGAGQGGSAVDWSQVLGGLGGGSVSSGWDSPANTGKLDQTVSPSAREKYTKPLGGGRDTFTIMVYMCGTDLESRSGMGTSDLQEMMNAQFGGNVNLLVYTGGCKGWKNNLVSSTANQVWQVRDGQLVPLLRDLEAAPMTDPSVLAWYIRWCAENYPASRYGLILWDHGGGSVSGYGYDEKFASSGSMDLAGVSSALSGGGVQFDFVGFDACLMATVETALAMAPYADYLIASEETEPGVGWYYTDWLTALGKNSSMTTVELGCRIVDSFVDTCARQCRGQLTTLSVVDLAELQETLPEAFARFSQAASKLIADKNYQTLSDARSGAREFAQSSQIDQVDLAHLAGNLGTKEGDALAQVLLSAVKYNRTSSNMTNAYGLSVYFPYRKPAAVSRAASTFGQVGVGEDYIRCIQGFAEVAQGGQLAAGTTSPLPSLLGELGGSIDWTSAIEGLLNSGVLSGRAMPAEEQTAYYQDNFLDPAALTWQAGEDGTPVLRLSEAQWGLVQELELNVFYDDGEGYIDLGLDNVFQFDGAGGLLGDEGHTWLAVNGQPAAYYHAATVDDGDAYAITGWVPVLYNGERAELILVFDNDNPYGYAAGVRSVYQEGETDTVAKSQAQPVPGDVIELLCDYYSYSGEYLDSYLLGDPITVGQEGLTISDVPLEGSVKAMYRFTDIYGQHFWSAVVPN